MRRANPSLTASLLGIVTVSAAALTTACAPEPQLPPLAQSLPDYEGVPLPPGAVLDDAGVAPTTGFQDASGWEGSLPPLPQGADGSSPEELVPDIVRRGRLVAGVDQSLYLLSYRDVTGGDLRGFEVDLAREIARDIFGDPEKVDFRFVGSKSRTSSLEAGEVDVVVRTMSVTPARLAQVDFSTPYLTSQVRVLVPKDRQISTVADLAGHTVCVVNGSNVQELVRERAPRSPILRSATWADCLMAVQQFHADAIIADDTVLTGMVAQDPYTTILPEALGTQLYGVGLAKGNDGATRQVNATLERLRRDGTWNAMYQRWLAGGLAAGQMPAPRYREEREQ